MRKGTFLLLAIAALTASCHRHEHATATQTTATTSTAGHAYSNATTTATAVPAQTPATATGTEIGSAMPDYSAKLLDGKSFDLAAEKGHVVFLNLWATWCGPCRAEIPQLEALHNQRASQGFEVVGVSLDEGGPDVVKEFVKSQSMTYPIVLDPEGKLANVFQTAVIPTSVLLDRSGKIVWKKFGQIETSDADFKKALDAALAAKS